MGRGKSTAEPRGPMDRDEIERYLRQVGRYLKDQSLTGEILIEDLFDDEADS